MSADQERLAIELENAGGESREHDDIEIDSNHHGNDTPVQQFTQKPIIEARKHHLCKTILRFYREKNRAEECRQKIRASNGNCRIHDDDDNLCDVDETGAREIQVLLARRIIAYC